MKYILIFSIIALLIIIFINIVISIPYPLHAIITTGVAGGLLCPCKGLLPAVHLVHAESLPLALLSQLTLKRLFTSFYLFVFSPVNGSIYSFRLI